MIKFIKDGHLYVSKENERYTSVTSLLHKLEPKKDWDKIAKNYRKET
jgi:hypothetical protein